MKAGLHIVADQNIALVSEYFAPYGKLSLIDGYQCKPEDIETADVLLVRSVTRVDDYLLSANRTLKFVGSATTGTDHIDATTLRSRGISFAHAPGSNAQSVVEYVMSAIASAGFLNKSLAGVTVGIVGYGTIGKQVAEKITSLSGSVIANDPPLKELGAPCDHGSFVTLDELVRSASIITIHVPLTTDGPHATKSLISNTVAERMERCELFINTSRGSVVDPDAIRLMLGKQRKLALDVWPNEPEPEVAAVHGATIATPHIAGYSFDGKVGGTEMVCAAMIVELRKRGYDLGNMTNIRSSLPRITLKKRRFDSIGDLITAMYDVRIDSDQFKKAYLRIGPTDRASTFARLRKDYPVRRSFASFDVRAESLAEGELPTQARALGVRVVDGEKSK